MVHSVGPQASARDVRDPRAREEAPVHCPFCRHADSRVVDSRTADDGTAIRRRRQCPECGSAASPPSRRPRLTVVKRSGVTEPFSRAKVVAGVRKACQGRPVSEDDLALLAQRVEEAVRATGCGRDRQPRRRPGDPRPAARARRDRLPAVRQRLPRLRLASRTSRPRSRCCAPSASPWGSSPPSRGPAPTRRKPAEPARSPPDPTRRNPSRPCNTRRRSAEAGARGRC